MGVLAFVALGPGRTGIRVRLPRLLNTEASPMWSSVPISDHKVSSAISMQIDIETNFDGKKKGAKFPRSYSEYSCSLREHEVPALANFWLRKRVQATDMAKWRPKR